MKSPKDEKGMKASEPRICLADQTGCELDARGHITHGPKCFMNSDPRDALIDELAEACTHALDYKYLDGFLDDPGVGAAEAWGILFARRKDSLLRLRTALLHAKKYQEGRR